MPQVPARVNSPPDAPPTPIDASVSVPPPAFCTVTVCGALCVPICWSANTSDDGAATSAGGGAGAAPVPVSVTTGTLPLVTPTASVALRAPDADGVNVSWIVHETPAPSVVPIAQVPAG